jgi:hypothetical protein
MLDGADKEEDDDDNEDDSSNSVIFHHKHGDKCVACENIKCPYSQLWVTVKLSRTYPPKLHQWVKLGIVNVDL